MSVKIAIADENPVFRLGLHTMITTQPAVTLDNRHTAFTVTGEAGSTSALLKLLAQQVPDILLLGYTLTLSESQNPLSGMDGLTLLKWLMCKYPQLKVIILSPHTNPLLIRTALKDGAKAWISRNISEKSLGQALSAVTGGEIYIGQSMMNGLFQADALSPREVEVLRLLCRGLSLTSISRRMHLSIKTVSAHKLRAMEKLNVASDCHLYYLLATTRMFDITL